MARKPWHPRSGLSGPQPTFAAQGKAPTSGWGVRRANAGKGSVSREGAFPDGEGQRLVLGSRPAASSSTALLERSTAAEARALRPPDLFLSDSDKADEEEDLKPLVSPHASDVEPDSDDPDRESSRLARARAAAAAAAAAKKAIAAPLAERERDDPQTEMRRLRGEAAARRAEQSKVVEVLDSDEESRAREEEQRRLEAGPQLVRAPKAKERVEEKGKGKGKAREKGKGRRLDETDESDGALRGLEAFKRKKAAGEARGAAVVAARDKGKGKAREAHFDLETDDDVDSVPAFSDVNGLPDPAALIERPRVHTRIRASTSARRGSPKADLDARAQRRARTSGRDAYAFVNDTDDERDVAEQGGAVIATGGSGAGRFRLRGPRDVAKKARGAKASTSAAAVARDSSADEGSAPPSARRARSSASASGSPLAGAAPAVDAVEDYSHLGIPAFVDPRTSLARRKKRELSSLPTSAFSSSDGGEDHSSPRPKGKDEFAAEEKRMRRKKRQYREERKPGYSNPRRN
ncbi:hypothetical protein JCM10450v2_002239 [Rhodotorula kratochvilovae]